MSVWVHGSHKINLPLQINKTLFLCTNFFECLDVLKCNLLSVRKQAAKIVPVGILFKLHISLHFWFYLLYLQLHLWIVYSPKQLDFPNLLLNLFLNPVLSIVNILTMLITIWIIILYKLIHFSDSACKILFCCSHLLFNCYKN